MDLFIRPHVELEKVAAEVDLPEDPNAWPKEVLDELFKQVPYIADFQPHVVMQRVDGERGYGFGHVEISNQTDAQMGSDPQQVAASGVRSVRIPVIIKDGKLCPFDLVVNDSSKVLPLTESRLRQALFRPQAFDITGTGPGDQSLVGQLYPPYRQNLGFAGGGMVVPADNMGKMSMVKSASVFEEFLIADLEEHDAGFRHPEKEAGDKPIWELFKKQGSVMQAVLPTIGPVALDQFWGQLSDDAGLRAAFTKNKYACSAPLQMLAEHEPMSAEKVASAIPAYVHPTVVQVSRRGGDYMVKSASHHYWRPTEELIERGALIDRFGEKVAFAVDTSGSVTLSDDATAKEVEKVATYAAVAEPGVYKVREDGGRELVGYVVPNLVDLDGDVLPIALFTNGSQATIQAEIMGEPVADGVNLPEGPIGGQGFFYCINQDGQIQATIPLTLQGSHQMGQEPSTFTGETYDGRPAEVSVQPNIQEPTPLEEGKLLLPQHWKWCSLVDAQMVGLAGGEQDALVGVHEGGTAGGEPGPQGPEIPETSEVPTSQDEVKESHVWVRGGQDGTFSLSGPALEKVGNAGFMDFDQAIFLLAGLGVDLGYGATKLAHAMSGERPEPIRIGRYITTAAEQEKEASERAAEKLASFPQLRVNLVKEASVIPDPTAVDTVLSLGFINPENLTTFVSYLPVIDDAQTKMCELLMAARLGMQDVPASALERAVRSTEEAIEGLKIIAFQE